jgi:hypothetical protein
MQDNNIFNATLSQDMQNIVGTCDGARDALLQTKDNVD